MKLTKKRGFSLVELMVVVAIMGTLAAIAIPAYNEYRKSAKKTAYRTDMLAFHKGVLAFGVELDSFCERETTPDDVSINNIGMQSLTSSKLYGVNGTNLVQCTGTCTAGTPPGSVGAGIHPAGSNCATGCTSTTVSGNGPGKANFIGFGTENCSNLSAISDISITGPDGTTPTTADPNCNLDIDQYDLGVYGHLAGAEYSSFEVNHNGVVAEQQSLNATLATGQACAT